MKCPHCTIAIHEAWDRDAYLGGDSTWDHFAADAMTCPECKKRIIRLNFKKYDRNRSLETIRSTVIFPIGASRSISEHVPSEFARDFAEAVAVLSLSPQASAALSRRTLQSLIRECARIKHQYLSEEIKQLIQLPGFPSELGENVDAIRKIGNLAAHPTKDKHTGEIVSVEPNEAEWLLDVLEGLFDYFFAQPAINKARREKLNAKTSSAGKGPINV
jgi:hypothetical protein